jgi:hypothetical protein
MLITPILLLIKNGEGILVLKIIPNFTTIFFRIKTGLALKEEIQIRIGWSLHS